MKLIFFALMMSCTTMADFVYMQETKGFSQVFPLSENTLGVLGGHRYIEGMDSPVMTFETLTKK